MILIAFLFIIYGMYLKISITPKNYSSFPSKFSANLTNNEKIVDIQVIDKNRLLVLIESSDNIKGAIYDIKLDKFIKLIER